MIEVEGKGVDYERYALRKLFKALVSKYDIKRVLEIPAKGEKAMPSLYSLAFAEAGCVVHLINAEERSKRVWQELGFKVNYLEYNDLTATNLQSKSYDLVWNFMYIAHHDQKDQFLKEMIKLSKRYILYIAVNRFNIGFYSHRAAHKLFNVPFTHGDINFMNPFYVKNYFKNHKLNVIKIGAVDTPPWPDSMGIRDMKLHKKKVDLNKIDWESRTIEWMKIKEYPIKIKLYYLFEILPLPFILKLPYAHLFYVLAEKNDNK